MQFISRFVFFVSFALSACAFAPPPEFTSYRDTFDRTVEATNAVLQVYGAIEKSNAPTSLATFDPNSAGNYVEGADGPFTGGIRQGFSAVQDYNLILARYASGESLGLLSDDIDRLNSSATSILTTAGLISNASGVDKIVGVLKAVGNVALTASDAAEFRESVLRTHPKMEAFLKQLRIQSASMYAHYYAVRGKSANSSAAFQRDAKAFQAMLGSWVLLIDETLLTLTQLKVAIEQERSRGVGLPVLAASAERMDVLVTEIAIATRELSN